MGVAAADAGLTQNLRYLEGEGVLLRVVAAVQHLYGVDEGE
jgi:hypothetical protein